MKRKPRGKLLTLFLALIFLSVFAAPSWALKWVDDGEYGPSGNPGDNPITYTLNYTQTDTDGLEFDATFTVHTSNDISPEWRLEWVAFNFSPHGGTIDTGSPFTAPDGSWSIFPPSPPVPGLTGWSGFYSPLSYDANDEPPFQGGALLTGGSEDFTWMFHIILNPGPNNIGEIFADYMPFQASFSRVKTNGKLETNRLSKELSIPEPTTMFLLGSALIGLGLLGRKKFKI